MKISKIEPFFSRSYICFYSTSYVNILEIAPTYVVLLLLSVARVEILTYCIIKPPIIRELHNIMC